jgi:hypothetical protein
MVLSYLLAALAAQIGALLGVLVAAGLMWRLDFRMGPGTFLYELHLSSGPAGVVQRAVLSSGRAGAAFVAARAVLSLFSLRFTLPFAVVIAATLLARDVWSAMIAERGTRLFSTSDHGARAVRTQARLAVPVGLSVSLLVAWLFVRV